MIPTTSQDFPKLGVNPLIFANWVKFKINSNAVIFVTVNGFDSLFPNYQIRGVSPSTKIKSEMV